MPRAADHVDLWRRQLGLLLANGEATRAGLEAEARRPGLSAAGARRLEAMARAVREQVGDFATVVGPALGGPLEGGASGLPRGVVEYCYYLFRDWGWGLPQPSADGLARADENLAALEALRAVAPGALCRVLVVGAGACRLAVDLHRHGAATETAVLDIDPYLLVIAEAVVRGRSVRLTEASLNVTDADHVSATWSLGSPEGPLGADAFHFFLANGLAPPFAAGTFDTVVTPWFIDRVPSDLPAFLTTVHGLLRPGGRWLNHGPLLYPTDVPLSRRYALEELLELARAAGFEVNDVAITSQPYLVSPLTGTGRVERVLTFAGTTREND
jgi:hypothetical protein